MNERSFQLKNYLSAMACCIVAVFLDQLTKHLSVIHLKGQEEIVLISGVFELRYLENRGAAFGLFQNRQIFLWQERQSFFW